MSDTCFRCHGPDKSSRMANMRLDIRDEALKPLQDGTIPIVPGDPEKSAIVQRIFATSAAKRMPPAVRAQRSDRETEADHPAVGGGRRGLRRTLGLQPIEARRRCRKSRELTNPIDAFIQDRLAKEGLKPSPEADRRTLIRRVSLDLTGLPPTPEEVRAFENDRSRERL